MKRKSVKEGESVTLDPGVTKKRMIWWRGILMTLSFRVRTVQMISVMRDSETDWSWIRLDLWPSQTEPQTLDFIHYRSAAADSALLGSSLLLSLVSVILSFSACFFVLLEYSSMFLNKERGLIFKNNARWHHLSVKTLMIQVYKV